MPHGNINTEYVAFSRIIDNRSIGCHTFQQSDLTPPSSEIPAKQNLAITELVTAIIS
jgi:hypothetical protein